MALENLTFHLFPSFFVQLSSSLFSVYPVPRLYSRRQSDDNRRRDRGHPHWSDRYGSPALFPPPLSWTVTQPPDRGTNVFV